MTASLPPVMAADGITKTLSADVLSSLSAKQFDTQLLMQKSDHNKPTIDRISPHKMSDTLNFADVMGVTGASLNSNSISSDSIASTTSSLLSAFNNVTLPSYGFSPSTRCVKNSMSNMLMSEAKHNDFYLYSSGGSDRGGMDDTLFRTTLQGGFPVKPRHRTTKRQYSVLERQFRRNPRPDAATRDALAARLAMRGRTVQIWFQNRRAKCKRDRERGRPTPPLPSMNNGSDIGDDEGCDDSIAVIDWDPAELDSEGGEELLLRAGSESSSSKLASGSNSGSSSLSNMIMPDFKENSAIDSWLANINLTSAESQLAQQLAATDASTAAYLNQLALTASGASGLKSDPISSLGSFSWWTSSDNLGHNSNTASTPMDGLSDSFVSSMLANAGLLNNDTAAGSKNELKEEGSMLDQDLAATGLASANWLLGTGIDPPSAAAAVAVAAAAASTGTTNHPFSLIATTPLISPETSSTEAAKEKVNIGITTENAELNEFRRQLREYREHISLEVPTLSL